MLNKRYYQVSVGSINKAVTKLQRFITFIFCCQKDTVAKPKREMFRQKQGFVTNLFSMVAKRFSDRRT